MHKQTDVSAYLSMQKAQYELEGLASPEDVVGSYDYHEFVPYETNLLFKFGDVRKPIFPDFSTLRAFDICCGEGRMVRRMKKFFGQVDGADISAPMIERARERTPGSEFWVTNGMNAGDAPSRSYDFAYCTISLQHICVFTVRDLILKDICRLLKDDGKVTFQYLFSRNFPAVPAGNVSWIANGHAAQLFRTTSDHATWFEDKTEALATNSGCDVVIGTAELNSVREYFQRYFHYVEFWFHTISIGREAFGRPFTLPSSHPNSHMSDYYWGTDFVFIHCDGVRRDIAAV